MLSNLVLGGEALSVRTLIVSLTATIIVAFTFQYLIRVISRATNFFLFRGGYDPQQAVKKLSLITSSTLNFEELLRDSVQFLKTTLRLHYCSFIIFGKDNSWRLTGAPDNLDKRAVELLIQYKNRFQQSLLTDEMEEDLFKSQLKRANVDMVQGLYVNNDCVGILILGQKEDGSAYNHQDTWFVTTCAANLAIAIQNAQRFEEIERFNQTLQEKIDDATRQLRRTNDKLRKLDETKDDFISMASHQLRTPLTSVKGYVSMVLDDDAGKINKQQRKLLSQAFISAERMVYLISDLLNVSRLKTGKFVIEPIKTNLARMVEEEVAQLVETAKGRHLELTFHKPEHFPTLMLDETKIRQVMMNFIDNALYYTPAGGHIDIHLADKPETIEFTVADDGIGVPTHEQHHLFSKFYRAPNAKRARPDGTGLGLFMAKKVIIAQGGAIIFKSKEHQGSTFGFTFAKGPLLPPAKETAPASSLAPQKATANK
ncbi:MAG TPA: GAF domain-containing sensor histidine kinase [Candidatus Saccharimonadales bacterium]|nr:GAF domain-containing sensor histidine kinase [Candidatus Saccharimonadales bacterium]